jgi:transcriptional regulator with XRE-family HTH domain
VTTTARTFPPRERPYGHRILFDLSAFGWTTVAPIAPMKPQYVPICANLARSREYKRVVAMSPEDMTPGFARQVGERLRDIRRQQGLSLQAVESASGREFKASVLGAYERGERIISVLRLQRLAAIYGVPVDQLLPRDPVANPSLARAVAGRAQDGQAGRDGEGPVTIDLSRLESLEAPEKDLIGRYLSMIQLQRGDLNGRVLTIRDEDVRALARLFQRDAVAMRDLMEQLGIRR